jgi:hypothetical protein
LDPAKWTRDERHHILVAVRVNEKKFSHLW